MFVSNLVFGERKIHGKTYDGIHRISFLIDANGNIEHVFDNFKPAITIKSSWIISTLTPNYILAADSNFSGNFLGPFKISYSAAIRETHNQ